MTEAAGAPPGLFEFGYIAKAHGLEGEVQIRTYDPSSEILDLVEEIVIYRRGGGEEVRRIEEVREGPKGNLLVVLEGVQNRAGSERLVGGKCYVRRADLGEPDIGEYFQGDLLGLEAFDPSGARLGVLKEIWNTGPVPNLVIHDDQGVELVVPFAEEFVPSVDLEKKRLVVRPPEFV